MPNVGMNVCHVTPPPPYVCPRPSLRPSVRSSCENLFSKTRLIIGRGGERERRTAIQTTELRDGWTDGRGQTGGRTWTTNDRGIWGRKKANSFWAASHSPSLSLVGFVQSIFNNCFSPKNFRDTRVACLSLKNTRRAPDERIQI